MPKLTDQPIAFPGPEPKFPKPSSLSSPSAAMSVDDCFVPLPTPLSEGAPLLKAAARCGSLPSLSELDPYATAAAAAAAELGAASAWCGDAGKGVRTVGELPGTLSVPSRYHLAISSWDDSGGHHLRPLIPSRDDSGLNLRLPALYEISRDRLLFLFLLAASAFTLNPLSFRAWFRFVCGLECHACAE